MPADPLQVLRLRASEIAGVVPAYTHTAIVVQPHALYLAGVAYAGDDALPHAVAYKTRLRHGPARVRALADPSDRDERRQLYGALGADVSRYLEFCERQQLAPQIVLTSPNALELWINLADDFRSFPFEPDLAALAKSVTFFTERAQLPGQQAVVILTDVLSHHWVPPLEPLQEQHLGVVLVCHDGPRGDATIYDRMLVAKESPMGSSTTPRFDNDVLMPRLDAYRRARRRRLPSAELAPLVDAITRPLGDVVRPMIAAMEQAVAILAAAALPSLPEVANWQAAEWEAFRRFQQHLRAGGHIPRRDRPARATRTLTERELRLETVNASIACHDRLGRVRAVWLGDALAGHVDAVRRVRLTATGRRATVIDVATTQPTLRLRVGDQVDGRDVAAYRGEILDVRRDPELGTAGGFRVRVRLLAGARRPGPPAVGEAIAFVRDRPDMHRVRRVLGAVGRRLKRLSWIQQPGAVMPAPRSLGPIPANPRDALEALR